MPYRTGQIEAKNSFQKTLRKPEAILKFQEPQADDDDEGSSRQVWMGIVCSRVYSSVFELVIDLISLKLSTLPRIYPNSQNYPRFTEVVIISEARYLGNVGFRQ